MPSLVHYATSMAAVTSASAFNDSFTLIITKACSGNPVSEILFQTFCFENFRKLIPENFQNK